jgi:hypothetical protein
MGTIVKDPLIHFLLIGAALFGLFAWRGEPAPERERIEVGAADVAALLEAVTILQGGRQPTQAEIERLVEPTIREEVLYREALKLGLDENDAQVRRRLIEKMAFLTQDLAGEPSAPTEAELEAFVDAQPERFAVPARVTFEHLFFSVARRGERTHAAALAALAELRAGRGAAVVNDPGPFATRYELARHRHVADLFGGEIAQAIFTLAPGEWHGPFRSNDGEHVFLVEERKPAEQPSLEAIREEAVRAFLEERRRAANEAEYRRIRAHYDIVIEMPALETEAGR